MSVAGGTSARLKRVFARALIACACALLGSCLVTDRIEFSEANVPANVTRIYPKSFSRATPQAGNDCEEEVDLSKAPKMRFEVDIYDANVDDTLYARVFVNDVRLQGYGKTIPARTDRSPDRGRWEFCVEYTKLKKRCNYVQIAVSRRFAEDAQDELVPAEEKDVSIVEYFVLGDSATAADASELDCALLLDPLGPDGGIL